MWALLDTENFSYALLFSAHGNLRKGITLLAWFTGNHLYIILQKFICFHVILYCVMKNIGYKICPQELSKEPKITGSSDSMLLQIKTENICLLLGHQYCQCLLFPDFLWPLFISISFFSESKEFCILLYRWHLRCRFSWNTFGVYKSSSRDHKICQACMKM